MYQEIIVSKVYNEKLENPYGLNSFRAHGDLASKLTKAYQDNSLILDSDTISLSIELVTYWHLVFMIDVFRLVSSSLVAKSYLARATP